jgi:hypothetical protein
MLTCMFHSMLVIHSGLWAKILLIMHSLFYYILVIFYLDHKWNTTLLIVSSKNTKFCIKSLDKCRHTLSGESSAKKHLLGS